LSLFLFYLKGAKLEIFIHIDKKVFFRMKNNSDKVKFGIFWEGLKT
jgi:hypothetical protein